MNSTPTVDVHAHMLIDEVQDLTDGRPGRQAEDDRLAAAIGPVSRARNAELAATVWRTRLTDDNVRLELMDRMGVDVQVISISPNQYHYWADETMAARLVQAANERIAARCAHSDRLVGMATVALQHPTLAAQQLRRAVTQLGLRGVEISTSAGATELDDPSLSPFWEAAEDLDVPVFIHPLGCTFGERLHPYYLGNVIGQPLETAIALARLILGGVLDTFPGLKLVGAHGGGYLPAYVGRFDHAWHVRPESARCLNTPSQYLQQLWVDSLVYDPDQLESLIRRMGADRVLLGSDYPYDMGVDDPIERLRTPASLDDAQRAMIEGGTAQVLFGLSLQT